MSKILVIGSTTQRPNCHCVGWEGEIPYVGDFELVIINLQSLTEEILPKLKKTLETLKTDLHNAIFAKTELMVITAPTIVTNAETGEQITNYSWFMVPIMVEAKNGKEFNKPYPQNQHFSQYFANIDQWESIFQGFVEDAYETRFRSLKEITATPLRQNKANKIISFTIKIKEHEQYHSKMKEAYSVYFLHPTTKCSIDEGIDLIIKAESKDDSEKEPLPEWTKVILLPKEDNIATKIKTTISDIEVKTKEKESLEEEFENLMEFKHLLTSRDHQLEEVVKKALRTIGITVNPAKYSDEDGVIIDPKTENEIPIEIGGMNKGLTAEKVRQLIDWSEPFSTPDIKCKGLLIANPFREKQLDEDLNGRGKLAEENIIEKAVPWGLAIISTIDIFKAVRAKLNGEDISDFIQKIFNSTGIVTFNPTPTAPLSSPSDDVSAEDAPSA